MRQPFILAGARAIHVALIAASCSIAVAAAADLFAGKWTEAGRVDLKAAGEAQGEGVAIAADGTVYVTGEGGGKSQPGTFARLACSVTSRAPA
jgi:hypothetical protein